MIGKCVAGKGISMEKRRLWEQETENVRMEPNADGKRFVRRGSRTGKLLGLAVLTASMLPLAPGVCRCT